MSEEINPQAVNEVPAAEDVAVNYADMTLGELSKQFESLMADDERMKTAKEAENF